MEKEYKLSFLGDVMCEPPLLCKVKTKKGYDFKPVFSPLKSLLSDSDYVVANLESPLAGPKAGYSDTLFSFNTPDCVVDALKDIGVKLVTTSNNHCLDRGVKGLVRTLDVLDKKGMAHTGTARPGEKNKHYVFKLGDAKISVYSATYGTNYGKKQDVLEGEYADCVNMLRRQIAPTLRPPYAPVYYSVRDYIKKLVSKELGREYIFRDSINLARALGLDVSYADDSTENEYYDKELKKVEKQAKAAIKAADVSICFPHVGGQFNVKPGLFSKHVIDTLASCGFDGILAAHSHTTQMAEMRGGVPVFYSLGNVSMCTNTEYACRETLPEYGLIAHLYIKGKKISRTTFSMYKIVEDDTSLKVVPVEDLYASLTSDEDKKKLEKDVAAILYRVNGKKGGIRREYELARKK